MSAGLTTDGSWPLAGKRRGVVYHVLATYPGPRPFQRPLCGLFMRGENELTEDEARGRRMCRRCADAIEKARQEENE